MKRTSRVHLSRWEQLKYYSPSLIFAAILLAFLIKDFGPWSKAPIERINNDRLIFLLSASSIIIVITFLIQLLRTRFKTIHLSVTQEDLKEAISRTARKFCYSITSNKATYARIESRDSMLTVIRSTDYLLINCTTNVSEVGPNYFNFLKERKIKKTFLTFLHDVRENVPAPTYIQVDENQWSIKRIMIRLFVYAFFIAPIFLIAYSPDFLFLLIISLLCLPYIYIDLKLILKQRGER